MHNPSHFELNFEDGEEDLVRVNVDQTVTTCNVYWHAHNNKKLHKHIIHLLEHQSCVAHA